MSADQPESPAIRTVPIGYADRWPPCDNVRLYVFAIVREILDGDILQRALNQLIRQHVPILGARVSNGRNGIPEYRLPEKFPANHTLLEWSSAVVDKELDSEVQSLEAGGENASIVFGPSVLELEAKWTPAGWPVNRKAERPDTPLVLVHLTQYTNATVLAINVAHIVTDILGLGTLLRSWMCVVRGEEPPPLLTLPTEALDGPDDITAADLRRKGSHRVRTKTESVTLLRAFVPELVMHPKEESHIVLFPTPLIEALRMRCSQSLKTKYGPDAPKLTNGDVLSSLLVKLANLHRKSSKMLSLTEMFTLRGRHPALPAGHPYLHNAISSAVARFPISGTTQVEDIAYKHRCALEDAFEPAEIDRWLAVTRELCRRGLAMHAVEPGELSYSITNWSAAWRDLDFGTAIKLNTDHEQGIDGTTTRKAKPIVVGHALVRGMPVRYSSIILSKSDQGYLVDFGTSCKNMVLIKKLLAADPRLETV